MCHRCICELLHFARLGSWDPSKAPALQTNVGSDLFWWRKCQFSESLRWPKGGKKCNRFVFWNPGIWKQHAVNLMISSDNDYYWVLQASTDSKIHNIPPHISGVVCQASEYPRWWGTITCTGVGSSSGSRWGCHLCAHSSSKRLYVVNFIKWHESVWEKISMNHHAWFMIHYNIGVCTWCMYHCMYHVQYYVCITTVLLFKTRDTFSDCAPWWILERCTILTDWPSKRSIALLRQTRSLVAQSGYMFWAWFWGSSRVGGN